MNSLGEEKERIDGYVLDKLFGTFNEKGRCIRLAIFFSPSLVIKEYLKQSPLKNKTDYFFKGSTAETKEVKDVNQYISPLIGQGYNLMICGFDQHPSDLLIPLVKDLNVNPYIFFTTKPNEETVNYWKERNAFISENSGGLSGAVRYKGSGGIEYYRIDSNFQDDHVMNLRNELVEAHSSFIHSSSKICQVVGLKGIGKKSFINELIHKRKIASPVIVNIAENYSPENIIQRVFKRLQIPYITDYSGKNEEQFLYKINARLEGSQSLSLIFYNAENLLLSNDEIENTFSNLFFSGLAKSDFNIKVYLVTSQELFFKDRSIRTNKLYIDAIAPYGILKIVNKIYSNQSVIVSTEIARQGDLNDIYYDKLDWLSGGHPEVVLSILDRFQPLSLSDLLNNPIHISEIEDEQHEIVSSFLKVNDEEKSLLEFLSLFELPFEYDAIQELHPKPTRILRILYRKRLILIDSKNISITHYFLPSLIRNYFRNMMSEDDKKIYKSRISRYFKYKTGL
jgi:hypothetical protein